MTMDDTKINGEQQEKQEYFMEEMPTSSPVTINISKSDKSETSVKFKAGKKNVFKHYKSDPEDKTKLVCNYCGESVKSSSRKIHYKYWHSGYREKMHLLWGEYCGA